MFLLSLSIFTIPTLGTGFVPIQQHINQQVFFVLPTFAIAPIPILSFLLILWQYPPVLTHLLNAQLSPRL
jgi:hypothetical protein